MLRTICLSAILAGAVQLMADVAPASGKSAPASSGESDRKIGAVREILLQKTYLNLPVRTGATKRRMSLTIDGRTVREFEIELADGAPDFWVFLDVSAFRGKRGTIRVESLDPNSNGIKALLQSDTIEGAQDLYREKHRQQLHFSSRRGWNNDSNGLVFHQGEYHLYYQHNPYGWDWGNMHWGHAVSADLVHWRELPIALYPQKFGDWCFSGSAVVDANNTAGFKTGAADVMVAAYTSTGRGECIAYSNDRGRTFTDYPGNPVVTHKGRDPKVIWYPPGRHWVMAVYDEQDKSQGIVFYTSRNLKDWQFGSRIDGFYECPEIFELPVDGKRDNRKWVVHAADGDYLIGRFDGQAFIAESGKQQWSYGNCFYASQTFNDMPQADGRRMQIAWGRIATPGMPFNQCMLFPCELTLRTTGEGVRMFAEPAREIETLHERKYSWANETCGSQSNLLANLRGDLFHIRAALEPGDAGELGLVIRGIPVAFEADKQELACQGKTAPLKPVDGVIRLEVLVDRTSIEIFGNGGRVYMPIGVIPADDNRSLRFYVRGGIARVRSLEVYLLRSAWE